MAGNILRISLIGERTLTKNITQYAFLGSRSSLLCCQSFQMCRPTSSSAKLKEGEDFWVKNKRMNRPMSPHLTIYQPQLTALLSVTHRGTGIFLAAVVSGLSIGMLALPGSYPHYLSLVETLPFIGPMAMLVKFGLSFSLAFHVCNGIRHLAWDLGYGFGMRNLYKSGYAVVAVSTVFSLLAISSF